jgi:argininosuccinate lyase
MIDQRSSEPARDGHTAGVLSRPLRAVARDFLFERHLRPVDDPVANELRHNSQVDRAHVVMLAEQGLVPRDRARRLLGAIDELRELDFAPLRTMAAPRGYYLAYEKYLITRLGPETGGVLYTGRSRNDLAATTVRLRLQRSHEAILQDGLGLARVLLDRSRQFRDVVMPAYTHHQPAVPITYGHYLLGVAQSVAANLRQLDAAGEPLDHSPLGAGAVGGTSVAIDSDRTAALLGFERPLRNSVYAVASRDFVLWLLSASAALGVTLCRLAHDLQAWSTQEAGLLRFDDDLVGSSSMMPQKRNPFMLEHVQGRAAVALGGFTSAVTAMSTPRFTNAIPVGTEAVAPVWTGIEATTEATVLLRLMVDGAVPDVERMRRIAEDGFTAATHLAERLTGAGVPFRTAHTMVGSVVAVAMGSGRALDQVARDRLPGYGPALPQQLDPADVVTAARFGAARARATAVAPSRKCPMWFPGSRTLSHGDATGGRPRTRRSTGRFARSPAHQNDDATGRRTMFEGELVRLRSVEEEHAATIHRWANDAEATRWLDDRYTVSLAAARRMVERQLDGGFGALLVAIETVADDVLVGTARIKGADPESRDGEVDIWIGDRTHWGRGYGGEALALLTDIGFDTMGLHRLTASVYADNRASLHVFQKAGFVVEGRLRMARWKNGAWRDVVILGMLAGERRSAAVAA